jgi:hypothetical protein
LEVLPITNRNYPDVTPLSQRARLAIALHLFQGFCDCCGITHPELGRYLDHLWQFIGFCGDGGKSFEGWKKNEPPLTFAGLGDPLPAGFGDVLAAAGVSERTFRRALCFTTEVLYVSMYAASDEERSRHFLYQLADMAEPLGVVWPDISRFAGSRWIDGHGWGNRLSAQELTIWREHDRANKK